MPLAGLATFVAFITASSHAGHSNSGLAYHSFHEVLTYNHALATFRLRPASKIGPFEIEDQEMASLFADFEVNHRPFWPRIGRLVGLSLGVHTGALAVILYVPAFRDA